VRCFILPRREESRVDQRQQYRWRRIGRQILWTVGAVVAVSAVVFVLNHFFVHRPLWDWLKLLVVPAILASGGLWFNAQQSDREQRTASDRAQDEALQAYLDQMSDMLIPSSKDLPSLYKACPRDSLSSVARARTLTVVSRLNGDRKARVVQFLYESGLIATGRQVVYLGRADLRWAYLSWVRLHEADLSGAYLNGANLSGTDLRDADLRDADLRDADLSGADLRRADLSVADLRGANLSVAALSGADLSEARLHGADLSKARLHGTDLSSAHLGEADLRGALGWTEEQLSAARDLGGATMPNGQKYEDWLKIKGHRAHGENGGTS
jgi:uncharacterized protein YjbI with pentapeptide repeats